MLPPDLVSRHPRFGPTVHERDDKDKVDKIRRVEDDPRLPEAQQLVQQLHEKDGQVPVLPGRPRSR